MHHIDQQPQMGESSPEPDVQRAHLNRLALINLNNQVLAMEQTAFAAQTETNVVPFPGNYGQSQLEQQLNANPQVTPEDYGDIAPAA